MQLSVCFRLSLEQFFATEGIAATQQDGVVHAQGVIVDGAGQTVIGATVRVVGSQTATVSDIDGNFKFDVPAGSYAANQQHRLQHTKGESDVGQPYAHHVD